MLRTHTCLSSLFTYHISYLPYFILDGPGKMTPSFMAQKKCQLDLQITCQGRSYWPILGSCLIPHWMGFPTESSISRKREERCHYILAIPSVVQISSSNVTWELIRKAEYQDLSQSINPKYLFTWFTGDLYIKFEKLCSTPKKSKMKTLNRQLCFHESQAITELRIWDT